MKNKHYPIRMGRQQAAEYLGITVKALGREVQMGNLGYVQHGSRRIYERDTLDAWLAERRVTA